MRSVTPEPRRADRDERRTGRLLTLRMLVGFIPVVAVGVPVGVVVGFTSPMFVVAQVAMIGGMLLQDRLAMRLVDRWEVGTDGEQRLDRFVDGLAGQGWRPVHDLDARGNIEHLVVGAEKGGR